MINWNLAKHPSNWLVILLMLVIVAMAGHLALSYFGIEPETGGTLTDSNDQELDFSL